MHAIALHTVSLTYPAHRRQPPRQALREVTLNIEIGQSVALLGPNGSGKSTLIRIITGMMRPSSGQARLFDRSPDESRSVLSVVFQSPGLDRHMTVWENLRDSAALYGIDPTTAASRIASLLDQARLGDRRDALVKTLSGGMARRVDLCRALLTQPRILVLDEPTTGLDPTARREFIEFVHQRRRDDAELTLLICTHLIDEAERMDRVLMMHEGCLVADDSPNELRNRLGVQRVSVHDAQWKPPEDEQPHWSHSSNGWIRDLGEGDSPSQIAQRLAEARVSFSIAPPTLSDVFERVTGARLESQHIEVEAAV